MCGCILQSVAQRLEKISNVSTDQPTSDDETNNITVFRMIVSYLPMFRNAK